MLVKNLEQIKLKSLTQPWQIVFTCCFKDNYFIIYPTHIFVFKNEEEFQKKCNNLKESVEIDQILPIDSGTFFFYNDNVYHLEVDNWYLKVSEVEETNFTFKKITDK